MRSREAARKSELFNSEYLTAQLIFGLPELRYIGSSTYNFHSFISLIIHLTDKHQMPNISGWALCLAYSGEEHRGKKKSLIAWNLHVIRTKKEKNNKWTPKCRQQQQKY